MQVEDLKSLLESCMRWHSQILPYYAYSQFVEKVEKLGRSKRVRVSGTITCYIFPFSNLDACKNISVELGILCASLARIKLVVHVWASYQQVAKLPKIFK